MKPVQDMTREDWLAHERRHGLRDQENQVIDDPDQLGFGFGERLNLRRPRARARDANQLQLFSCR